MTIVIDPVLTEDLLRDKLTQLATEAGAHYQKARSAENSVKQAAEQNAKDVNALIEEFNTAYANNTLDEAKIKEHNEQVDALSVKTKELSDKLTPSPAPAPVASSDNSSEIAALEQRLTNLEKLVNSIVALLVKVFRVQMNKDAHEVTVPDYTLDERFDAQAKSYRNAGGVRFSKRGAIVVLCLALLIGVPVALVMPSTWFLTLTAVLMVLLASVAFSFMAGVLGGMLMGEPASRDN